MKDNNLDKKMFENIDDIDEINKKIEKTIDTVEKVTMEENFDDEDLIMDEEAFKAIGLGSDEIIKGLSKKDNEIDSLCLQIKKVEEEMVDSYFRRFEGEELIQKRQELDDLAKEYIVLTTHRYRSSTKPVEAKKYELKCKIIDLIKDGGFPKEDIIRIYKSIKKKQFIQHVE